MNSEIVNEAESLLVELRDRLTLPAPRECLPCYLSRMVAEFGCTHRLHWALRWREHRAPRATGLERKLRSQGGSCDCEALINVYPRYPPERDRELPPCSGVRSGSTQPCRGPRQPRRPRRRKGSLDALFDP